MRQGPSPGSGHGCLRQVVRALGQFIYGMTIFEMARDLERERARAEQRFAMLTLGSLVGLPVPANYYSLRLVPYALPCLPALRRSLWRERDLADLCEQDLT
ncbi:MAG TPA: hypothetical protein PLJ35_19705 [Anaerolineae bacterium]|nr:hypothetical protein [Anaerolineae bacterium]HPL27087.1 hypothetical protein [Anaerolineae bacterium]